MLLFAKDEEQKEQSLAALRDYTQSAQTSIDICCYVISGIPLIECVLDTHGRRGSNLSVRVVCDKEQYEEFVAFTGQLSVLGITVCIVKILSGSMRQKLSLWTSP